MEILVAGEGFEPPASSSRICLRLVKGAQAIALGVYMCRKGFQKDQIKHKIESMFGYTLSHSLHDIRPGYHFYETCPGSVPQAIIAFLESSDFEDALRNAISLGGDADTQACISGALAEAYYLNIPSNIKEFVVSRITVDMLLVLNEFQERVRVTLN